MASSIERVHITVDGVPHALAPLESADDLRGQVLQAVRARGGFLTVTTDDGKKLSVLVTPSTSVTIAVTTVHLDADSADTAQTAWEPPLAHYGDDNTPFDFI